MFQSPVFPLFSVLGLGLESETVPQLNKPRNKAKAVIILNLYYFKHYSNGIIITARIIIIITIIQEVSC